MEIENIKIFIKVIQNGSLTKAAISLNIPKSTVSRAIKQLEEDTGTQLMVRTTRNLSLTASGRAFYDSCLNPLQTIEDAYKSLYGQDSIISGHLRITAPEDLGTQILSTAVSDLSKKHAQLSFELNYTDEIVDLVKENFDIAIRLGKLNTSSFKARKVAEVGLIVVSSVSYLKAKDKIKTPHDLLALDGLAYHSSSMTRWSLRSKKETIHLAIKPKVTSNQMTCLLRMCRQGAGIALIPRYLCEEDLKSGRLIHVLPEWEGPSYPVWIVTPMTPTASARLKVTTEHLATALKALPK